MPRPAGVRNHDFAEKKADLIARLCDHALNSDLRRPALRQFAQAVGASEPTLRHYFGDRSGLIVAILEEIGARGAALWELVSQPSASVPAAVEEYYRLSEAGMRHGGFVRAHAFGIIEGVADPAAAAAYRRCVLNPSLDALRRKLAATPGAPAREEALEAAALALFTPLLGISLVQDLLGGARDNPTDRSVLLRELQGLLSARIREAA